VRALASIWLRAQSITAIALTAIFAMASCGGPDPATANDVTLAGIDTSDLIPRERHEWSKHVSEFLAPCPEVAVSIAQCVRERRACEKCVEAAEFVKKAVRDGMSSEQVERLYHARYDPVQTIPLDGSPSRGPEAARVVIVEFADFECTHCAQAAPTLEEIWKRHEREVRFVFKYLPLSIHPHAELAARAAIAAQAQGKFWEMHDVLFANQRRLERGDLDAYARAMQLDLDRFNADFDSPATNERLRRDREIADLLKIRGTPTLYINNRLYEGKGASIEDVITTELARK
jgi:protein-disulfide isomerase